MTLIGINKLAERFSSKCYLHYKNRIRLLENESLSGSFFNCNIISESYLQYLALKSPTKIISFHIIPNTIRRYVDNKDVRLQLKTNHFGKIRPCRKLLNILDSSITNSINDKYEFKVHRKDLITNIYVKQTTCMSPDTIKSIYEVFLQYAQTICSTKMLTKKCIS